MGETANAKQNSNDVCTHCQARNLKFPTGVRGIFGRKCLVRTAGLTSTRFSPLENLVDGVERPADVLHSASGEGESGREPRKKKILVDVGIKPSNLGFKAKESQEKPTRASELQLGLIGSTP